MPIAQPPPTPMTSATSSTEELLLQIDAEIERRETDLAALKMRRDEFREQHRRMAVEQLEFKRKLAELLALEKELFARSKQPGPT